MAEALGILAAWKRQGGLIPSEDELDAMSDEDEARLAGVPPPARRLRLLPRLLPRRPLIRVRTRGRSRRGRRATIRRGPARSPGPREPADPPPSSRHGLEAAA